MANRFVSPSAFGLCLVFGLTAYVGANILSFVTLEHRVWFEPTDKKAAVLDDLASWTKTISVETAARSLVLEVNLLDTPRDNAAIERALDELAAAAPTSTATWQSLAEFRKTGGASMESVLAAFRMSALTGSHEGYFMMQRAIFGITHWNELPDQDRRIVVRDILGSVGPANGLPGARYRRLLAAKPEAERESIKAALLESGLATKDIRQALGV